jgi:transglutaminase-like putative cysteine protease
MGAALGAVVLPLAIGWASSRGRWSGPATLAAWVGGGVLYTIIAVVPGETARGIPTGQAVAAWWQALRAAPEILRTSTTPVDPTAGALLLALLAIWAACAAAYWSALRLDGTLGAVMPTLALFVAVSALGDGAYALLSGIYAATCALFLLARQQVVLADRRTWFHVRPARHSRLVAGGLATVAAIATLGAILGPQLPSAQSAALFDYQELGEGRGGPGTVRIVSPLVNIGDALNQETPAEVFTVRSSVRTYWRLVALDNYDGSVWGLRDTKAEPGYPEPQISAPVGTTRVRQTYTMGHYGGPFLPAAFQAVDTRFLDQEYSIHESTTLFLESGDYFGLVYEVESVVPEPTRRVLETIPAADPDRFADLLELPDDFPDAVADVARAVTASADGPFDQAIALQNWFRDRDKGGFEYDTTIKGHDEDALERFVLEDKKGFCEQFAGSYAAMARAIGLPARVAVGFTPGTLGDDGLWHVSTKNAHAWPEVYFEGIGWTRFEPTPGRYEPTSTDYTGSGSQDPNNAESNQPGESTTTTAPDPSATTVGSTAATSRPTLDPLGVGVGSGSTSSGGRPGLGPVLSTFLIVVGGAAALAFVVVGATFAGAAVRRRRRHRAPGSRGRVLGAWAQALERLAEVGVHRRPSTTPVEFAMREAPASGAGPAGPALLALAHLQTSALYAPDDPSDDDAEQAWRHVDTIERAIAASTRRSVRWKRRIRPDRSPAPGPVL